MTIVRCAAGAALALVCAFAMTGPWRIGSFAIRNWQPILGACVVLLAVTRTYWRDVRPRRWVIVASFVAVTLVLGRILLLRYAAFEINAWDFSISFDRPIEQTVHGNLLWSDTLRMSMLGVHANWLMFAFVPLYALVASPYWLIAGHVVAVAGAALVIFLYGRHVLDDDVVALLIAAAFLCNRYTVRSVHHGFVIDAFYPLGFVLLLYAFRRGNLALGLVATLFTASIKEDAVLTLAGVAIVIGIRYRAWRWTVGILAIALAVFAIDYAWVIPMFRGEPVPFSAYWGSFGATPLAAAAGMLTHPVEVLSRVLPTSFYLLVTFAFLPLFGRDWMLAALPTLVVYASADTEDLRRLALHYSLPIIGLLFAAAIDALAKRGPHARRNLALLILFASVASGSGYKMSEPRPERAALPKLLASAGPGPVYVQGAVFPHIGYALEHRVLHHDVVPPPDSAFLLCVTCNPYPFTREEYAARLDALRTSDRYRVERAGDLWLFAPRSLAAQHDHRQIVIDRAR
jgi:uncharacterized membrane protein